MARKAYVLGVESLKSRLESKTKVMDVYEELMEIGREMNGLMYASEDFDFLPSLSFGDSFHKTVKPHRKP